ncbi:MAG: hydrogenase nickel incorporation protein HypB [Candidatus Methanofastidiosia archaeon]
MKKKEKILISVEKSLLDSKREVSLKINKKLRSRNIKSFDVMGSVGAGKTTLIKRIVESLNNRVGVIAADLTTTIDKERIEESGAKVVQINTVKMCHLDGNLILENLENFKDVDVLLIENVGNLICPAEFPLGCDKRIVVISVTEGPYTVKKHPYTIIGVDVVVNKIDLAQRMEVFPEELKKDVLMINPKAKVFLTNAKNGDGVDELVSYLMG